MIKLNMRCSQNSKLLLLDLKIPNEQQVSIHEKQLLKLILI